MDASSSGNALPHGAFVSAAPTLTKDTVERFGRQMLVEEIGAAHMEQIRHAHVVCVGAGGLGSTILLYLAAAGVGRLTIIDFDDVELSNLQRQVIHTTAAVGQPKALSAKASCLRLFPGAHVDAVVEALTPSNAERLLATCDVVVDGTDNVAARYLINDAAMRCGKPLVSGSAIGWDGQLSVYGYRGGPCYRCLFPQPPPPEAVGSCNDSGVMGPLPGMIGCLQALEVLKVATGVGETLSGRLFLFNGLHFTSRVVKLRGRQPRCVACSGTALADATPLADLAILARPEYVPKSCAAAYTSSPPGRSCSASEYAAHMPGAAAAAAAERCITLDVRARVQYDMAHLPHSVNVPYQSMQQWQRAGTVVTHLSEVLEKALPPQSDTHSSSTVPEVMVYVLCRRGINSLKATALIQAALEEEQAKGNRATAARLGQCVFQNVSGGLNAYHCEVDRGFPYY
ncbi:molybdopterin synthase sulfurylase-like protein, putative [Leishmania panamensis]|uniref:Adenylyltransferase and sulfurtransferase MOCS3 homolog n=1 Tax=Leishmania panamensis TaxID=5679 RepID=A0A088SCV6_LEIPA|nr:molybdopterin synthase sulfurylase-like protein, putative [Leishmania panamensis]AIN99546.1 molybdopterin synthase sulfurylase-like protein, putative [Leishmania panamensis]